MTVPRKVEKKVGGKIFICFQCKYACDEQIYRLTHIDKDSSRVSEILFCCWDCMMDYFEVKERVHEMVHKEVTKEKKELHKRVCPACIRRFAELE